MNESGLSIKLFITGRTTRSEQAIANLQHICEKWIGKCKYEIQVIDVLEQPELAEQERIIATPTLVKVSPPPVRRIIGDLSDTVQVVIGLGLSQYDEPQITETGV